MSKISLTATRLNFYEKFRQFIASSAVKKALMLFAILLMLGASIYYVYSAQSAVSHYRDRIEYYHGTSASQLDIGKKMHEHAQALGRSSIEELEVGSSAKLNDLAQDLFGPLRANEIVSASVHYNLIDVDDFLHSSLHTKPFTQAEINSLLDEGLQLESYIKLELSHDELLDNFDLKGARDFARLLDTSEITQKGQRSSLLCTGPASAKLFAWSEKEGKLHDFEMIALD